MYFQVDRANSSMEMEMVQSTWNPWHLVKHGKPNKPKLSLSKLSKMLTIWAYFPMFKLSIMFKASFIQLKLDIEFSAKVAWLWRAILPNVLKLYSLIIFLYFSICTWDISTENYIWINFFSSSYTVFENIPKKFHYLIPKTVLSLGIFQHCFLNLIFFLTHLF